MLISRLGELGDLQTYQGPQHPTAPKPEIALEIASFLETYPFLLQDQGYIAFLECYAGACSAQFESSFWVEIFGFSPEVVSLHIVDGEGEIVDEDGFMPFALIGLGHDAQGCLIEDAFAFDSTQLRPWGIYWKKSDVPTYEWLCTSFQEWLEKVLSRELLYQEKLFRE